MDLSSVPRHNFIISSIDYLESIGSLNSEDLLNVDPFHYTLSKKPHPFISAPISSKKPLSIGMLPSL